MYPGGFSKKESGFIAIFHVKNRLINPLVILFDLFNRESLSQLTNYIGFVEKASVIAKNIK